MHHIFKVESKVNFSDFFFANLERGPRVFLIRKISDINPEFGKFSEHSKLIIFSMLTKLFKVIHLESLNNNINIISNSRV